MAQWAIKVRYPGVPENPQAPAAELPAGVDIASMTVCGPTYTTLHMTAEADNAHDALEIGQHAADRVALSIGLAIQHAEAVTALP